MVWLRCGLSATASRAEMVGCGREREGCPGYSGVAGKGTTFWYHDSSWDVPPPWLMNSFREVFAACHGTDEKLKTHVGAQANSEAQLGKFTGPHPVPGGGRILQALRFGGAGK